MRIYRIRNNRLRPEREAVMLYDDERDVLHIFDRKGYRTYSHPINVNTPISENQIYVMTEEGITDSNGKLQKFDDIIPLYGRALIKKDDEWYFRDGALTAHPKDFKVQLIGRKSDSIESIPMRNSVYGTASWGVTEPVTRYYILVRDSKTKEAVFLTFSGKEIHLSKHVSSEHLAFKPIQIIRSNQRLTAVLGENNLVMMLGDHPKAIRWVMRFPDNEKIKDVRSTASVFHFLTESGNVYATGKPTQGLMGVYSNKFGDRDEYGNLQGLVKINFKKRGMKTNPKIVKILSLSNSAISREAVFFLDDQQRLFALGHKDILGTKYAPEVPMLVDYPKEAIGNLEDVSILESFNAKNTFLLFKGDKGISIFHSGEFLTSGNNMEEDVKRALTKYVSAMSKLKPRESFPMFSYTLKITC